MTESSLSQLSDFLSDAVFYKFTRMSDEEFSFLFNLASAYEQIWSVRGSLYEAKENGDEVDEFYFNIICNTVEVDLMKLAGCLNYDELHMECIHAQPVPNSEPLNIFLVYRIRVGTLVFHFQCQAGTDGVFNYFVSTFGGDGGIDDAWDYYIQHTPCAVV